MRQLASDALHKKATLEQERFDRLFGSLERINAAFGDSFSELSADGEGDLRYSREPLTLFKVATLLLRSLRRRGEISSLINDPCDFRRASPYSQSRRDLLGA